MKNKFKLSALFLAAVVFLSATGHVFTIHFCAMEMNGCSEKRRCCCEKSKTCIDGLQRTSGTCCINTLNYLINPFSVRQPENQVSKINTSAREIKLLYFNCNPYAGLFPVKYFYNNNNAPPGQADLLTMISTFQI